MLVYQRGAHEMRASYLRFVANEQSQQMLLDDRKTTQKRNDVNQKLQANEKSHTIQYVYTLENEWYTGSQSDAEKKTYELILKRTNKSTCSITIHVLTLPLGTHAW